MIERFPNHLKFRHKGPLGQCAPSSTKSCQPDGYGNHGDPKCRNGRAAVYPDPGLQTTGTGAQQDCG